MKFICRKRQFYFAFLGGIFCALRDFDKMNFFTITDLFTYNNKKTPSHNNTANANNTNF